MTNKYFAPKNYLFLIFLGLILSSCENLEPIYQPELVQTKSGIVKGEIIDDIAVFKGIPFATPPVGDLRWKAPQDAASWEGEKICTTFSASPIQADPLPFMMWSEEYMAPRQPLDEDCLYLNVWSGAKSADEKLPVVVWIYGGAFQSGGTACPIYDGLNMSKKGIVFVSVNYRLGIYGFISHPELDAESETGTSGNYGIMDQIKGLQWVKDNISAFGGDPNNVTVAGQSAGSMAVNMILASPLGEGLFNKAIPQSGSIFGRSLLPSTSTKGIENTKRLETLVGTSSIVELRKMDAEELRIKTIDQGFQNFGPVRDGHVLPLEWEKYLAKVDHSNIGLMTGWVTGDGSLFNNLNYTMLEYLDKAEENYGSNKEGFLKLFPAGNEIEMKESQARLSVLTSPGVPTHMLSQFYPNAYLYEFNQVPTDKPDFPNYGAFHSSEIPYVFNNLHTWDRPWKEIDFQTESTLSEYWANFIKTGNPNGEGLPEWSEYHNSGEIMELNANPTPNTEMPEKLIFLENYTN